MIQNLFPIPVGHYKLERDLTLEELNLIKNQETRSNMGNRTSVNNIILKEKELFKIEKFIEEKLKDYFIEVYSPDSDVNLKITQSWANFTEQGEFHHVHTHANSFISGVFYIQADVNLDRIYFHRDGHEYIKLSTQNWNPWNSRSWWVEVKTGDLLLFPSSLPHMVKTVEHDKTRISLSFNTYPVGCFGGGMDLTGLTITGIN